MKNLGKKLLLLFLFHTALFAGVKASLDANPVFSGELVTYRVTMSGNEMEKPLINDICGNKIVSTASSTNIEMVNGGYEKKYTLSYQFMPQKSCEIAPVEVKVDGKVEKSNAISLRVKKASEDVNPDFSLVLEPSKKELYVGEPFELTLVLKQKRDAQAVDSQFEAPDFKGFWVKSKSEPIRSDDGEFLITKVHYTLSAQRDGNLTIVPAQLQIATRHNTRDVWGSFSPNVKWRTYFSDALNIHAKPLPNGATLIGDFKISAVADKTEINQNEAVNVTIQVVGSGNLEDIKSFKPYNKDVNVFDEKIQIDKNKLSQKLVFVSDRDFTIPPFSLVFFNTTTGKVEKITTQKIDVKVNNDSPKSELKITRDETPKVENQDKEIESQMSLGWIFVAFVVGIVFGVVIMLLNPRKLFTKDKSFNIKDEKLLLVKLLPFKADPDVAKIIDMLEENIYSTTKQTIDKKMLGEIIKKYAIS